MKSFILLLLFFLCLIINGIVHAQVAPSFTDNNPIPTPSDPSPDSSVTDTTSTDQPSSDTTTTTTTESLTYTPSSNVSDEYLVPNNTASPSNSKLSAAAIGGIAGGAALLFVIFCGLAILILLWRKKRKTTLRSQERGSTQETLEPLISNQNTTRNSASEKPDSSIAAASPDNPHRYSQSSVISSTSSMATSPEIHQAKQDLEEKLKQLHVRINNRVSDPSKSPGLTIRPDSFPNPHSGPQSRPDAGLTVLEEDLKSVQLLATATVSSREGSKKASSTPRNEEYEGGGELIVEGAFPLNGGNKSKEEKEPLLIFGGSNQRLAEQDTTKDSFFTFTNSSFPRARKVVQLHNEEKRPVSANNGKKIRLEPLASTPREELKALNFTLPEKWNLYLSQLLGEKKGPAKKESPFKERTNKSSNEIFMKSDSLMIGPVDRKYKSLEEFPMKKPIIELRPLSFKINTPPTPEPIGKDEFLHRNSIEEEEKEEEEEEQPMVTETVPESPTSAPRSRNTGALIANLDALLNELAMAKIQDESIDRNPFAPDYKSDTISELKSRIGPKLQVDKYRTLQLSKPRVYPMAANQQLENSMSDFTAFYSGDKRRNAQITPGDSVSSLETRKPRPRRGKTSAFNESAESLIRHGRKPRRQQDTELDQLVLGGPSRRSNLQKPIASTSQPGQSGTDGSVKKVFRKNRSIKKPRDERFPRFVVAGSAMDSSSPTSSSSEEEEEAASVPTPAPAPAPRSHSLPQSRATSLGLSQRTHSLIQPQSGNVINEEEEEEESSDDYVRHDMRGSGDAESLKSSVSSLSTLSFMDGGGTDGRRRKATSNKK